MMDVRFPRYMLYDSVDAFLSAQPQRYIARGWQPIRIVMLGEGSSDLHLVQQVRNPVREALDAYQRSGAIPAVVTLELDVASAPPCEDHLLGQAHRLAVLRNADAERDISQLIWDMGCSAIICLSPRGYALQNNQDKLWCYDVVRTD